MRMLALSIALLAASCCAAQLRVEPEALRSLNPPPPALLEYMDLPVAPPVLSLSVSGQGVSSSGGTDPAVGTFVSGEVLYVRPYWSNRDFTLAIPPAYAPFFPSVAGGGHVDTQFTIMPQVGAGVRLEDQSLEVRTKGDYLYLAGNLNRQLNGPTTGTSFLTANYDLNMIALVPVEAAGTYSPADYFGIRGMSDLIDDSQVDLSFGTRCASITQSFVTSSQGKFGAVVGLANGSSNQSFQGAGLTSSLFVSTPVTADCVALCGARGSLLVGPSRRDSNSSVVLSGFLATPELISEEKTRFVPAVEVELGVGWGLNLGQYAYQKAPFRGLQVHVSAVGQWWGGVGPIGIGSSTNFRSNDLFLAGLSIRFISNW